MYSYIAVLFLQTRGCIQNPLFDGFASLPEVIVISFSRNQLSFYPNRRISYRNVGCSLLYHPFAKGSRAFYHYRTHWHWMGVLQAHSQWKGQENLHDRCSITGLPTIKPQL
jgi:hypothetical protein